LLNDIIFFPHSAFRISVPALSCPDDVGCCGLLLRLLPLVLLLLLLLMVVFNASQCLACSAGCNKPVFRGRARKTSKSP
jgi:hypothetical protein